MLLKPKGAKSLAAENIALRQQLLILKRKHRRSPKLTCWDRLIFSACMIFVNPKRILKAAIIIKPATLLKFHKALVNRKYHLLFSSKSKIKPGPKCPPKEIIQLIIDMKIRNPRFGARRIAMQITNIFGIEIDKNVVLRVLAKHKSLPTGNGPSWLSFIGHMKDSLWSIDFFRCESISLKSHWIMIVMDQFTRRIIGFSVQAGDLDGIAICNMWNRIISNLSLPKYLSSDNDPLFQFHRWIANLDILDITQIRTLPYVPISHPFVERLIGTTRREYLDHILFINNHDLQLKLDKFKYFYNEHRAHHALSSKTPHQKSGLSENQIADINKYQWQSYAHGIFQLPIAA